MFFVIIVLSLYCFTAPYIMGFLLGYFGTIENGNNIELVEMNSKQASHYFSSVIVEVI